MEGSRRCESAGPTCTGEAAGPRAPGSEGTRSEGTGLGGDRAQRGPRLGLVPEAGQARMGRGARVPRGPVSPPGWGWGSLEHPCPPSSHLGGIAALREEPTCPHVAACRAGAGGARAPCLGQWSPWHSQGGGGWRRWPLLKAQPRMKTQHLRENEPGRLGRTKLGA